MRATVLLACYAWTAFTGQFGRIASAPSTATETTTTAPDDCIALPPDEPCPLKEDLLSFYLYTRETQTSPYQLSSTNMGNAPFNASVQTKILIHGYTGWKDYAPNPELRAAYFAVGEYNIISLDWSRLAIEGCYVQAAANVKPVGRCTAKFIEDMLAQRTNMKPEDVHVIGFSLGAHVAGNTGRALSFNLTRMTVLDPAMPLFEGYPFGNYSVEKSDAKFMDVVHTNAGMKGKPEAVGDVDFYMNNGVVQPDCSVTNTSCSHYRAVLYYAESIGSKIGFWGYNCSSYLSYLVRACTIPPVNDWVLMGEYVNKSSQGSYFVDTNSSPPYARGKPNSSESYEGAEIIDARDVYMGPKLQTL